MVAGFLTFPGPHDIDCSGVERGLDVHCIVFLDHLHARAAVLRDLVDVSTFHKSQADVGMAQAVRRSRSAVAIEAKILFVEDRLEKLALPLGEN